jgi:DEAD/DEAH box helicase domain-containing protein
VIEYLAGGRNVIITTPTASGKTLAFSLPIFERLTHNPQSRALVVYPTKSLSNDQLQFFREVEEATGIKSGAEIYDGDTPRYKREFIRQNSRIVISNPFEIHRTLLWHSKWSEFFRNLEFVVFDEAHVYTGIFGSNTAMLVRRLRRVCEKYGSRPVFVLSSATLANPLEFATRFAGQDLSFELVSEDGSPASRKHFVFYNPYFDGVGTLSTHEETVKVITALVRHGRKTLGFTVSRKMAELVARWTRDELERHGITSAVSSYRAGYLPEERRQIERAFREGELKAVVSTSALELGIDIGSLEAVVISGFPGSVLSTWQRAGRAGRRGEESIIFLIGFQGPLDQYYMKHPEVFFGKPHESAIVSLDNPYILSGQILCASAELPLIRERDEKYFGESLGDVLEELKRRKLVARIKDSYIHTGRVAPTEYVQLESMWGEEFRVMSLGRLLEKMDIYHAYREAHPGAVLYHRTDSYVVTRFDLDTRLIEVERRDVDYYTEPLIVTDITVTSEESVRKFGNLEVHFGSVHVTENPVGYKLMRHEKSAGTFRLNLPPLPFDTKALWYTLDAQGSDSIEAAGMDLAGGLHGAEHAMIGVMPVHLMADRRDIGGVSTLFHEHTQAPTVFIYDGYPGGIGIAEKASAIFPDLAKTTLGVVQECRCRSGCPGCIYSPKCGNDNRPLDKHATIVILQQLLQRAGAKDFPGAGRLNTLK